MPESVSVIIPAYNRAGLLRKALASVAAQTAAPAEVIVVDDGSAEDLNGVIGELRPRFAERESELIYHRQPNGGPAKVRNTGIGLARGGRIAFLDNDDLWHPEFVATLDGLLDQYPSAGLAFGGMDIIDAHDAPRGNRPTGLEGGPPTGLLAKPFHSILDHMPMGTPCVMARRSVVKAVGPFDTTFRLGEDWDLWYRIARAHDFAYTLRPLTLCREHAENTPKWNGWAWSEMVRLDLKHLPEVTDNATRAMLTRRIRQQSMLLQEQLLREGNGGNGLAGVLDQASARGLTPAGFRFRVGSKLRRGPRWVGKAYAGAVSVAGMVVRGGKAGSGGKG